MMCFCRCFWHSLQDTEGLGDFALCIQLDYKMLRLFHNLKQLCFICKINLSKQTGIQLIFLLDYILGLFFHCGTAALIKLGLKTTVLSLPSESLEPGRMQKPRERAATSSQPSLSMATHCTPSGPKRAYYLRNLPSADRAQIMLLLLLLWQTPCMRSIRSH